MLCAALLRHEGCPQWGLGPLGRRFITGMSGRFLSTVHFPDSNPDRTHLSQAQRPTHRSVLRDSRVGDGRTRSLRSRYCDRRCCDGRPALREPRVQCLSPGRRPGSRRPGSATGLDIRREVECRSAAGRSSGVLITEVRYAVGDGAQPWEVQTAQRRQVRAAGRAASRSAGIASPQPSQIP